MNVLSQQFTTHGLQFFKVNKTVTHAAVARPHFLDVNTTPVSTGIKRIIEFINATPKCNRRKILATLAPAPAPAPVAKEAPAADAPASPATAAPAAPTPEQSAVIGDLHWLIHQGHVIEFANGLVETAKAPLPRPVKPARPAPEKPKTPAAATGAVVNESVTPAVVEAVSAEPAVDARVPVAVEAATEPATVQPPAVA